MNTLWNLSDLCTYYWKHFTSIVSINATMFSILPYVNPLISVGCTYAVTFIEIYELLGPTGPRSLKRFLIFPLGEAIC
jgi:hypothetical protein